MFQWTNTHLKILVLGLVVCVWGARACVSGGAGGAGGAAARLAERLALPAARRGALPALRRHVEVALSTRWPDSRVQLFGSTVNGLAHRDSDVDLRLLNGTDGAAGPADLRQVQSVLARHPALFSEFHLIVDIPVLKFKHIPSGFNVDLGVKLEGVINSKLIRYLLGSGCKRHLTLLLKHWGVMHPARGCGFLPSYGIGQLVIFYLQQKQILPPTSLLQKNVKPFYVGNWNFGFEEIVLESRNNETLYELLGGFFEFYADFDFNENIISTFVAHPVKRRLFEDLRTVPTDFSLYVRNVESHTSMPLNISSSASRMCLQDAFHHNKNVAELLDTSPESQFRSQVKRAALMYRENDESVFLEQIINI